MSTNKDLNQVLDQFDSHLFDWLAQLPENHPRFSDQREAAAWFEYWTKLDEEQQATQANQNLLIEIKKLHDQLQTLNGPKFKPTEKAENRQARRYQMCIDAGLELPESDFGRMPNGINVLAKKEHITRQAFCIDVKKHINKIRQRQR